jgi:tRNA (guanine37-N1)-methyltransferase
MDERIRDLYDCEELSIGDYVLTSGNLAAMVVIDAVTRLLPGALGCDESGEDESFSEGLLEYPQYTRPVEFRGLRVPAVLQSGDHGAITRWRRQQAEKLTRRLRPDLYKKAVFERLAGIPMKEWKKTTKKFLIQKEILKNGNSQESRSGIPEK